MTVHAQENAYRIGEVALRVGVTTRTIRYYEELGLLGCAAGRPKGGHRLYSEANVTRLQELIRLRDLLGLSLDELVEVAEGEETCDVLRNRWESDPDDAERLRIIEEAFPIVEHQLALVRTRQDTLAELVAELEEKLRMMKIRRRELRKS
jgi:DNA-binding transcriptional MerR regulator